MNTIMDVGVGIRLFFFLKKDFGENCVCYEVVYVDWMMLKKRFNI